MWSPQLQALPGQATLLAPDLPGLGASASPPPGTPMSAYADEVVAWMDEAGFVRPVVAGLSMGGYVAFELWRRHRERVGALVLLDTKPAADPPDAQAARTAAAEAIGSAGMAAVVDGMIAKALGATTRARRPEVVDRLRRMILATDPDGAVAALHAMRDRADSTADLAGIDVPTAVVVGEEDELTPVAVARDLADRIPGASFRAIAGAGHVTALETPDEVSRALAAFLEELPRG